MSSRGKVLVNLALQGLNNDKTLDMLTTKSTEETNLQETQTSPKTSVIEEEKNNYGK